MRKSMVRLNSEAHAQLRALVHPGRAAAAQRLHARIVLKADVGADRRCWTDAARAAAVDTSAPPAMGAPGLYRTGPRGGVSAPAPPRPAVSPAGRGPAAQLLAVACRAPPEGRGRWTRPRVAYTLSALYRVTPSVRRVSHPRNKPRAPQGSTAMGAATASSR